MLKGGSGKVLTILVALIIIATIIIIMINSPQGIITGLTTTKLTDTSSIFNPIYLIVFVALIIALIIVLIKGKS